MGLVAVVQKRSRPLRNLFFLLVCSLLTLTLWARPAHIAKGSKVYWGTEIKAPTLAPEPEPEQPPYRVIFANVSAYTSDSDECGKNDGITASGVVARSHHTVAMDGVPFGTVVEIEGNLYVVEDRFGGGYTDRIDIFMDTKAEAFQWGRRRLDVKIYEK